MRVLKLVTFLMLSVIFVNFLHICTRKQASIPLLTKHQFGSCLLKLTAWIWSWTEAMLFSRHYLWIMHSFVAFSNICSYVASSMVSLHYRLIFWIFSLFLRILHITYVLYCLPWFYKFLLCRKLLRFIICFILFDFPSAVAHSTFSK